MTHLYAGFVDRISKAFESALAAIEAGHNFEYGGEFEVALCNTIRRALPQRFGICRGYVINRDGDTAGDDIIIYDRHLFPTGRFLDEDIALKEKVPIEAAAVYIEAKHTLNLEGDLKSKSSLSHALAQAAKVKKLCEQREAVPYNQIARHVNLGAGFNVPHPEGYPTRRDAFYTAIISRRVRIKPKGAITFDSTVIHNTLSTMKLSTENGPDLVVAGQSNVAIPFVRGTGGQQGGTIQSPFLLPSVGALACYRADNIAFGAGLCHLLWALDSMVPGSMPWNLILGDAILSGDS